MFIRSLLAISIVVGIPISGQELCAGQPQTRIEQLIRDGLNWENYWHFPSIDLGDRSRSNDALIFWNDDMMGYCSRDFAACAAYDFDGRNLTRGRCRLFLNHLDHELSNIELEREFLRRLNDGPTFEVTHVPPTPNVSGVPLAPRSDGLIGAIRKMNEASQKPTQHREITVRSCIAQGLLGAPEVPQAIRMRRVPSNIESLAAWWKKQCLAQHCPPTTLVVPYYTESEPDIPVLLESGQVTLCL